MTLLAYASAPRISLKKVGLTLALLATQMLAQAASDAPAPADPNDTGPVIVSTDPVKKPSGRRNVKQGPVKPETYPTKPQQQVHTLR